MTKPTLEGAIAAIKLHVYEQSMKLAELKQCKVCGLTIADYEPRMTQGNKVYHIACMNNA